MGIELWNEMFTTALGLVLGEEVPCLLRYHGGARRERWGGNIKLLPAYLLIWVPGSDIDVCLAEWNGDDFAAFFMFTLFLHLAFLRRLSRLSWIVSSVSLWSDNVLERGPRSGVSGIQVLVP